MQVVTNLRTHQEQTIEHVRELEEANEIQDREVQQQFDALNENLSETGASTSGTIEHLTKESVTIRSRIDEFEGQTTLRLESATKRLQGQVDAAKSDLQDVLDGVVKKLRQEFDTKMQKTDERTAKTISGLQEQVNAIDQRVTIQVRTRAAPILAPTRRLHSRACHKSHAISTSQLAELKKNTEESVEKLTADVETLQKNSSSSIQSIDSINEFCNEVDESIRSCFLQESFGLFDVDNDGTIDKEELALMLKHMGKDISDEDVDVMFAEADEHKKG